MPTTTSGTIYWALTDNENSVRDWITYGSLVDHIVYDAFGKIDASHSSMTVPFAFGHNGVFYDPSSGLEWHSQPGTGIPGRWYNPATRRWMSADPHGPSRRPGPIRLLQQQPDEFRRSIWFG